MNITFPRALCVAAITILLSPAARAGSADLLGGLWMESANYPASSIVHFERDGEMILGKYRQVSVPQKQWGFAVGETVIKGKLEGKRFTGHVLLKLQKDFIAQCPDIAAGWAAIELELVEPGKLYGRWRQTYYGKENPCEVVGHSWQLYGLEKIEVE